MVHFWQGATPPSGRSAVNYKTSRLSLSAPNNIYYNHYCSVDEAVNSFSTGRLSSCIDEYAHTYDIYTLLSTVVIVWVRIRVRVRVRFSLRVHTHHLSRYVTSHPGQLSLAIPSWVGAMSTSQRAVMPCGWGVKAGMVRVWVAGKTVWSPYTRAISERFRDKELIIKRYINSPSLLYFTFIYIHATYKRHVEKGLTKWSR